MSEVLNFIVSFIITIIMAIITFILVILNNLDEFYQYIDRKELINKDGDSNESKT